jgi:hypothetical protein
MYNLVSDSTIDNTVVEFNNTVVEFDNTVGRSSKFNQERYFYGHGVQPDKSLRY